MLDKLSVYNIMEFLKRSTDYMNVNMQRHDKLAQINTLFSKKDNNNVTLDKKSPFAYLNEYDRLGLAAFLFLQNVTFKNK